MDYYLGLYRETGKWKVLFGALIKQVTPTVSAEELFSFLLSGNGGMSGGGDYRILYREDCGDLSPISVPFPKSHQFGPV